MCFNYACQLSIGTVHAFIHLGYFYSASSSPLLLRGAPDNARILCQSFMPKCHRQLRVKDLPKVPMWQLEWDSNPRTFGRKAINLPMSHHAPQPLTGSMCFLVPCIWVNLLLVTFQLALLSFANCLNLFVHNDL